MELDTRSGLDVIGDVHGNKRTLEALLGALGYQKLGGTFRHPARRKALFLGDLIDRGDDSRGVLSLVRAMTDAQEAVALMGNHELNAVNFATRDAYFGRGHYRPHTTKNITQHRRCLEEYGLIEADGRVGDIGSHNDYQRDIAWLRALPLWFETPDLRAIHAAWIEAPIAYVRSRVDAAGRLRKDSWRDSRDYDHRLFADVESLLKGPEIALPEGAAYSDKDGAIRTRARLSWWREADAWNECVLGPPELLRALAEIEGGPAALSGYAADAPPVFFGHYWFDPVGGAPFLLQPNAACLDFSIAKGASGLLAAYRWNGESRLLPDRLIGIDAGGRVARGAIRYPRPP